ncbi:MAG: hypothetical protein ACOYOV_13775 [Bacteroidales bacterium]
MNNKNHLNIVCEKKNRLNFLMNFSRLVSFGLAHFTKVSLRGIGLKNPKNTNGGIKRKSHQPSVQLMKI